MTSFTNQRTLTTTLISWFVSLLLLHSFLSLRIIRSEYVLDSKPYVFHMFENFEATKEVFLKEQDLLPNLRDLRNKLQAHRDALSSLTKNESHVEAKATKTATSVSDSLSIISRETKTFMKTMVDTFDVIQSHTVDFPGDHDFQGSVSGLMLLYDTYQFNLTDFARGRIETMLNGHFVRMDSPHRMSLNDMWLMAVAAYKRTWYDTSIMLLKETLRLAETSPKENVAPGQRKQMLKMRRNLVDLNNQYITKKNVICDQTHKVLPYVIDQNMDIKKKQPKKKEKPLYTNIKSQQGKEFLFRSVCNGFSFRQFIAVKYDPIKCGYLHHQDPFLKLAPFKFEVINRSPYLIILHEIFTEKEMSFLVERSRPNLSRKRDVDENNSGPIHEFKSGKKRRIIHKTVQYWMPDIVYHSSPNDPTVLADNDTYTIKLKELFKLSKKLEMATSLNLTAKYASTPYQVTNYGLGGLCETHIDPTGHLEGKVELPENRKNLQMAGDMVATVMGWLEDSPVGGATAFIQPYKEFTVFPTRGSAAFWFNLDKKGFRDQHTSHGGCPVLKGSKWILNKWIYYFDQVNVNPCTLDPAEKQSPFSGHY